MAMKTKEIQQNLVNTMRQWQTVERKSIASTGAVIGRTESPLIQLVMEIIRHDSQLHERIQQFIIDHVATKPVTLTPDDLAGVSAPLEDHLRLEDQMVEAVNASAEKIRGHKMLIEEYLLDFLIQDEKKHAIMLRALDKVKRGMYPYA